MPDIEGSLLDPGDIWLVVILACVNETSIWDTYKDTDGTLCDETTLTWLHTLARVGLIFIIADVHIIDASGGGPKNHCTDYITPLVAPYAPSISSSD